MNPRDFSNPAPSKPSAFHPVKDNPQSSLPSSLHQQPPSARHQLIYESEEQPPMSGSYQNDDPGSQDYYCLTCHENFNIRISPCDHKKNKIARYKCDIDDCKRQFNIGSGLERHKLVHTGAKPYQCDFDQCDQKFNQKSNLNRHRRIHMQEKPFICEKCCKSFTTTTNLKQHVQVHFEDKEKRKKYVCEIKGCNKEYLYMCNLKKHKQEHEDPLGDCIGQKKPDFPAFSLSIGNCSFRILYKRAKDHSEHLITYREVQSAINYSPELFSSVLEAVNSSQDKPQFSCIQAMESVLAKLLQSARNSVNICFQIHSDLIPVGNLLIKAAMGLASQLGAKIFTVVLPSFAIFRDVTQNLLNDLQPNDEM